ncbi:GntR family transcriptional regulator [Pigmentiphaga sp. H8]|uniref:GntR family transcriptional regulator n=1 Tax=unclassified Pigmentiphaga TaxID=2626614 RepID=UPI000F5A7408|nr:GntR family transcriptional regulator [Pigmentiphaga sp. H8]AZG09093.1 GntR family transcriptional regulator [Pigmentiphaga sp. H8]
MSSRPPSSGNEKKRSETLRETIEELIAVGELSPGDPLDETVLANRFGVSRTPIREALIQLASAGLVEMRPRKGALVAQIGPQRLIEMFDVMGEIEAMCARLAARRMTADDHRRLLEAHRACQASRNAGDANAYYYLNEVFHRTIYGLGCNGFLNEEAIKLHRRLGPYRRLQLRVRDRIATSYDEHEGIVEALLAGDAGLAAERARDHVVVQGQRFADLMASLSRQSA